MAEFPMLTKLGLLRDDVKMKNPKQVEELLNKMISAGPDQLQVLADFDYTVTHWDSPPSFGTTISENDLRPLEYKVENRKFHKAIMGIITSPGSVAEKTKEMIYWYRQASDILAKFPLSRKDLHTILDAVTFKLRDGGVKLMKSMHSLKIPFVIVTAGGADVVEYIMPKHFGQSLDNVTICGNSFKFDAKDNAVGLVDEIVHVYNKDVRHSKLRDYYKKTGDERQYAMVLGDYWTDADICKTLKKPENGLKIAFTNPKWSGAVALDKYVDLFDIVLIEDPSFSVVQKIIDAISSAKSAEDNASL